jgi:surface polysaccharide O-acyltransferase-like enzyme
MQVCAGIIMLVVGGLDINNHADQRAAIILNDVTLIMVFVILIINVVISGFGMEHSSIGLREVQGPPK